MAKANREPILPFDVWLSGSLRRIVVALVVGVATLSTAFLWGHSLSDRVADRIAVGTPLEAEVVGVKREKIASVASVQRVTVRYAAEGRDFEVPLMAMWEEGDYRIGQRVTVYTDPGNPSKIATTDGFASEGWLLRMPMYVGAIGAIAILVASLAPIYYRWRRRRWQ